MRNTMINKMSDNKGFSLVEMSVVLIVLGLVISFMVTGIHQWRKNEAVQTNDQSIGQALNAIGSFRASYGRYPCPARANATVNDVDYGRESRDPATGDCVAVADGVWLATSNRATLANRDVFIGVLPFRQMNLDERFTFDAYHGRMTYAVTGLLANDDTYANDLGGITIVNADSVATPDSLLQEPDSAHFVLINSNIDGDGSITREGNAQPCPADTTLQHENCNRDSVFRADQVSSTFDDIVNYQISDSIEQWQISETDIQDIHLKSTNNFAVGVDIAEDASGFAMVEVSNSSGDDGVVVIREDAAEPAFSGTVRTNTLCNEDGTGCFEPQLIGGEYDDDETLRCDPETIGGNTRFMVSVEDGQAICQPEIYFTCPAGEFFSGFDGDGNLICSTRPPTSCPDQELTTTCGQRRDVSAFFRDGSFYGYGYSGECHRIEPLDTVRLDGMADVNEVRTYINDLNDSARITGECGPDAPSALIRDTYQCLDDGTWNTSSVNTIERGRESEDISRHAPLGGPRAETGGPDFNPAAPMSVDRNNSDGSHDCWCREDYRVRTNNCSGDSVGQRFRIERHNCPQTDNRWSRVYPASGWDERGCGCVATQVQENQSCSSYFGYWLEGQVILTYNVSCPSGATGQPVRTLISEDTSSCRCPTLNDGIRTVACPQGETNSFSFDGRQYRGVAEVYRQQWICPGGPGSLSQGYWQETLATTRACVSDCSAFPPREERESCPAGQDGAGTLWRLPYLCDEGRYAERSDAYQVGETDCRNCSWQISRRGGLNNIRAGRPVGEACNQCGSDNQTCYETAGGGSYYLHSCSCTAQR